MRKTQVPCPACNGSGVASAEGALAIQMRAARIAAGMSQADLAEALKIKSGIRIDPTGITRMESGNRTFRLNEALAIQEVLGLE